MKLFLNKFDDKLTFFVTENFMKNGTARRNTGDIEEVLHPAGTPPFRRCQSFGDFIINLSMSEMIEGNDIIK